MNLIATGCGLTSALVGLFVVCFALSFVWPSGGGAHAWIRLFASDTDNVVQTLIQGMLGSAAAAWLTALLFIPVYNRLAGR